MSPLCAVLLIVYAELATASNAQLIDPDQTEEYNAADFDKDGDVDKGDFIFFTSCATGPAIPQNNPACQQCDLDNDSDVDQADFAIYQRCYNGSDSTYLFVDADSGDDSWSGLAPEWNGKDGPKATLSGTNGALSSAGAGDTIFCIGTLAESRIIDVNPGGGTLTIRGYRPDANGKAVITNGAASGSSTIRLSSGVTGTIALKDLEIQRGNSTYTFFILSAAANLELEDCIVNHQNSATGLQSAIYYSASEGATRSLTLTRTTFKNTYYNSTYKGHCMEVKDMGSITITDCVATDNIGRDFLRISVASGQTTDVGTLRISGTIYEPLAGGGGFVFPVINTEGVLKCSRMNIKDNSVKAGNLVTYVNPEANTPPDVLIENNDFVRAGSGTSCGIGLGNDTPGTGNPWGNVVVRNNTLSDTEAVNDTHLVLLSGNMVNATFEGNLCLGKDHSNYVVVIKGPGTHVCYNKIYGVKALFLRGAKYARVYNNSIVGTNTWAVGWDSLGGVKPEYMRIYNNIIVADGAGVYCLYDNDKNGNHHSLVADYNLYYWLNSGNLASLNDLDYVTLTELKAKWVEWQAGDFGEENDQHSIDSDPLFSDVQGTVDDDWNLLPDSPAIKAASHGGNIGAVQ